MEITGPIRTVRKVLRGFAPAALLMCSAAVAAAQSPTARSEAERPGRLFDIGGRKLHIHCIGSGQPTVVFEGSYMQFALDWWLVQPAVGKTTRACSYDRGGLGWSDPAPGFENAALIVSDLHAVLAAAGEKPPYVFVTISMGAFYARAYQMTYPRDVVGFVFLEPAHEDAFLVRINGKQTPLWSVSEEQAAAFITWLNDGIRPPPPQSPPYEMGPPFNKLPINVLRTRLAFQRRAFETSKAQTVADQIRDFESRRVTAERLHSADAALGSLPVIVLTAEQANLPPLTRVGPAKTAALSSNSARRLVKSTHMIHLDAPSIVVKAIGEVLNAVRTNSTLESPP